MAILKGFPPSNTISPTTRIDSPSLERWHAFEEDNDWDWGYRSIAKPKVKFTVEIIEEEKWLS